MSKDADLLYFEVRSGEVILYSRQELVLKEIGRYDIKENKSAYETIQEAVDIGRKRLGLELQVKQLLEIDASNF